MHISDEALRLRYSLVPRTGIEPVRAIGPRDFKSLASASSATPAKMEAAPRIELGMKDLQSSALPLGYAASDGAEDGI